MDDKRLTAEELDAIQARVNEKVAKLDYAAIKTALIDRENLMTTVWQLQGDLAVKKYGPPIPEGCKQRTETWADFEQIVQKFKEAELSATKEDEGVLIEVKEWKDENSISEILLYHLTSAQAAYLGYLLTEWTRAEQMPGIKEVRDGH